MALCNTCKKRIPNAKIDYPEPYIFRCSKCDELNRTPSELAKLISKPNEYQVNFGESYGLGARLSKIKLHSKCCNRFCGTRFVCTCGSVTERIGNLDWTNILRCNKCKKIYESERSSDVYTLLEPGVEPNWDGI